MSSHWMISADSHVVEPPELWLEHIEPRYRDVAPRVVELDGADFWVIDKKGKQRSRSLKDKWLPRWDSMV